MGFDKHNTRSSPRRPLLALLLAGNLAVILSLAGVCYEMRSRTRDAELAGTAAQAGTDRVQRAAREFRSDAARWLADVRKEAELAISRSEERIRNAVLAERTIWSNRESLLAETLSDARDRDRREWTRLVEDSLRRIETSVHERIDRLDAGAQTDAAKFRRIQEAAEESLFMVHSRYSYEMDGDGGTQILEGTGWGTGFILGEEGYLVTNKHVVQPWKFDGELLAMEALGQARVLTGSIEIYAWKSGTPCTAPDGSPLRTRGFNSGALRNLEVAILAPDSLANRTASAGGAGIPFKVHALDNHDLAILRLKGGPFRPVATPGDGTAAAVAKLDPVMAVGFPRGHRGLERGLAESSPTLGTVRKAEDTIQVTASIIPGNSGGPLYNSRGEVVGVATRIYSETLGICIRIEHALELLRRLKRIGDSTAAR